MAAADMLMQEHDYKQLPIVDSQGVPKGIVTRAKIAILANQYGQNLAPFVVEDAILETAVFFAERDIFGLLDSLKQPSAILLVDHSGKLSHIVTNRDTAIFFRERAEELILLEYIEVNIKSHITNAYTNLEQELQSEVDKVANMYERKRTKIDHSLHQLKQAVISVFERKGHTIDMDDPDLHEILDASFPIFKPIGFVKLTFDGIINIMLNNWSKFNHYFKPNNVVIWRTLLEDVRDIRNKVFHFKGDISNVEREKLHRCAGWLEKIPMQPVTRTITENEKS